MTSTFEAGELAELIANLNLPDGPLLAEAPAHEELAYICWLLEQGEPNDPDCPF